MAENYAFGNEVGPRYGIMLDEEWLSTSPEELLAYDGVVLYYERCEAFDKFFCRLDGIPRTAAEIYECSRHADAVRVRILEESGVSAAVFEKIRRVYVQSREFREKFPPPKSILGDFTHDKLTLQG